MIRIAVCDDNKAFSDLISRLLTGVTESKGIEAAVTSYNSGRELICDHGEKPYDVLFLDIDMPEINGFEVARSIRADSTRAFIIFVTAKTGLVYESFDYQPFGFICKDSDTLEGEIEKTVANLSRFYKQGKTIEIYDGYIRESVDVKDIIYVKSEGHYLSYITADSKRFEPIRERAVLASKEAELAEFDFAKPHARYLVNLGYVKDISGYNNTVSLSNGEKIPISRSCKDAFTNAYKKYTRR